MRKMTNNENPLVSNGSEPYWEAERVNGVAGFDSGVKPTEAFYIRLRCKFRDLLCELRGAPLAVFLDIALHMNREDTSWPGLRLIAEETGYAVNTVMEAIKVLEARDYVEVHRGARGQRTTYVLRQWATAKPIKAKSVAPDDTLSSEKSVSLSPKSVLTSGESVSTNPESVAQAVRQKEERSRIKKKEVESAGAKAPDHPPDTKPKERKPRPRQTYSAPVEYARAILKALPNDLQRAAIDKAVKNTDGDMALWKKCVDAWRMAGYKPTNIKGILDWYGQGGPPQRTNGTAAGRAAPVGGGRTRGTEHYGDDPAKLAAMRASIDEHEWDWLDKKAEVAR